jgi:lipopolysaccharide biosynthesis glycosyltransferase
MNIAYSSSDYYFEPTYVSIYSLLKNSREKHKILLLTANIPLIKVKKLEQMVVSMGSEFLSFDITEKLEQLAKDFSLPLMRGGYSTYARVFLPDILVEIDDVLLIDSDTLIVGDVSSIEKHVSEHVMLACRDYVVCNKHSKHEDSELSSSNYYNMGVLRINLKLWRERNLSSILESRFDRSHILKIADQTMINRYLNEFIGELKINFNYYTYFHYGFNYEYYKSQSRINSYFMTLDEFNSAAANPIVLHFIGTWYERPWFKFNICPYSSIYIKYWKSCFPLDDLFEVPLLNFRNAVYDNFSLFLYKCLGVRMYFKFRYYFVQALKNIF